MPVPGSPTVPRLIFSSPFLEPTLIFAPGWPTEALLLIPFFSDQLKFQYRYLPNRTRFLNRSPKSRTFPIWQSHPSRSFLSLTGRFSPPQWNDCDRCPQNWPNFVPSIHDHPYCWRFVDSFNYIQFKIPEYSIAAPAKAPFWPVHWLGAMMLWLTYQGHSVNHESSHGFPLFAVKYVTRYFSLKSMRPFSSNLIKQYSSR